MTSQFYVRSPTWGATVSTVKLASAGRSTTTADTCQCDGGGGGGAVGIRRALITRCIDTYGYVQELLGIEGFSPGVPY